MNAHYLQRQFYCSIPVLSHWFTICATLVAWEQDYRNSRLVTTKPKKLLFCFLQKKGCWQQEGYFSLSSCLCVCVHMCVLCMCAYLCVCAHMCSYVYCVHIHVQARGQCQVSSLVFFFFFAFLKQYLSLNFQLTNSDSLTGQQKPLHTLSLCLSVSFFLWLSGFRIINTHCPIQLLCGCWESNSDTHVCAASYILNPSKLFLKSSALLFDLSQKENFKSRCEFKVSHRIAAWGRDGYSKKCTVYRRRQTDPAATLRGCLTSLCKLGHQA